MLMASTSHPVAVGTADHVGDFIPTSESLWNAFTGGTHSTCIAGNCIGYIRLTQSQKQCIYLSKVYCYFVWEKKFLAVRRVGLMTHRESRVDRPFPVT